MSFLISHVSASNINEIHSKDNIISLIIIILIFVCFCYFIIIIPQNKRIKEHSDLINSISIGDEILTKGGIIGEVIKILNDNYVLILTNDNKIFMKKHFIISVFPKGTIKNILL
ncbi:preprotein translocase subunit YajC [Enterobacteriaceae endosymbiont of Donacia tomentosa]|uniref:preprotein translocase subunit YajC n=1 Tax=Enterobacteriaceae endosymbiont of Donacia tomentosa TaxID=2675787 RepID=UPI001449A55B|nr:preprotein translocase subunit YajC [Enterobacteriaceae endosymbiont of Donacia tomentosa]QJC31603.1 preprotein translocase subunit YajC [Enterobacteriaceae endosymbiont of Donacia tomentosa]